MTTILNHLGEPVAVPPTREIGRSSSSIYGKYTIQPYDPGLFVYHNRDPLIAFKGFRMVDKMLEDPQVAASLAVIRYGVLGRGFTVTPADAKNPRAVELARFVEHSFKTMKGTLEEAAWKILDCLPRGYSLCEKVWEVYKDGPYRGKLGIKAIKAKKPGAWRFDLDDFDNVLGIQALGPGVDNGQAFPIEKFVHMAWDPEYENPYGQSVLRRVYRHWWAKDATIKFWNVFNDKFGAPTVTGKYESGESPAVINQILGQLKGFQTEQAIAYPKDWEVGLLEVTRSGQSAYEAAVRYHDEQIALGISFQSLATNQHSKGGGSRAQGEVHEDSLKIGQAIVKTRLEDVINEQVVRQMVEYNFADHEGLYPTLRFGELHSEDLKAIAEVIGEMMDRGVVGPGEEWVRERLKFPADERTPEERGIDLDRLKPAPQPGAELEDPKRTSSDDDPVNPSQEGTKPSGGAEPERTKSEPDEDDPPRRDHAGLSRALTPLEGRMDFARVAKDHDELEQSLIDAASSALASSRSKLIAKVREKGLWGSRANVAELKKISLPGLKAFEKVIREYLERTFERGLAEGKATVDRLRRRDHAIVHEPDVAPVGVREMAAIFLDLKPELIGLEVESSIVEEVRAVLLQAVRGDWSEAEAVAAVGEAFSKWIEETIGDERATRAPNLKAVVRTNLNDAYNQGLRASYEAPENRGFVTALMYSSVLDHRTTPFCRAWDGVIRKIDDPIWKRVSPPNHYGERAVLLPLTRDDSFELTKDLPTIKPQTGF